MTTNIITKICRICNTALPLEAFNISRKRSQTRDGRCRNCFNRLRREYVIPFSDLPPAILEKFWANVSKTSNCWLWQRTRDPNGYGRFSVGYKTVLAHRFSAMILFPDLTPDIEVMHQCDNPPCVNPKHFKYGTQADNMADMVNRNRQAVGSRHSQAKLKESDVLDIRRRLENGEAQMRIAKRYLVSATTISKIATRAYWTHI